MRNVAAPVVAALAWLCCAPIAYADPSRSNTAAPPRGETTSDGFVCTQVIGFSQTRQWYTTGRAFEKIVPNERWQLLAHDLAGIEKWADPDYSAWNDRLNSPCARKADSPDRVLLTITGKVKRRPQHWVPYIERAIANIRHRYPSVRQIILQAVVGGPQHQHCSVQGKEVRASRNHPLIDEAIALLASGDVVAGFSPEVTSCAEYRDFIGHLRQEAAAVAVARRIAEYYRDFRRPGR